MTAFFVWNVRGFNQTRKHNVVRNWIKATKISFGCLVKTRVQEVFSTSIIQFTFPGWSYTTNYEHHRLRRIWLCWSNEVDVSIVYKSAQTITCWVKIHSTGVSFLCSFVYASNFAMDRQIVWNEFSNVKHAVCHRFHSMDCSWRL